MRKFFLILAVFLLPLITFAQHRSEGDAISIARSFWGIGQSKPKAVPQKTIRNAKARVAAKSAPTSSMSGYYIINDEARNRFVIVSADQRLYTILGYSDNGVFDPETAPLGLLDMLNEYDGQIQEILSNLDVVTTLSSNRNATIPIAPLLKSKWDQNSPYNDECPTDVMSSKDENCATGCVATAMAQVMYYYKYPDCGRGSNSYTSDDRHIRQSMNFASFHPDWNEMIDEYDDNALSSQKSAVAQFMHACGVSVSMDYATSSGAYALDMAYALSNFWKYSPRVSYKKKQYYSDAEWTKIINNELSEGHPILYAGSGNTGGHQFVLDGCNGEGMYHFNFGWSGIGDGYYSLSVLAPFYDLAGIVQLPLDDYTSRQEMVCYIRPTEEGNAVNEFYSTHGIGLSNASVGDSKSIYAILYNYSSLSPLNIPSTPNFNGKIGVGLFDKDFNFVMSLADQNISLGGGKVSIFSGNIRFDSSTFYNGSSYYIAYYAYSSDTGYSIVKTEHGLEDYYLASVQDGKITFEAMTEMGVSSPDVNNVVTGYYNATTTDRNGESLTWQITLWQDERESNKYWIANLDPIAKNNGYSYNTGCNKIYGYTDTQANKIEIPVNQNIGPNLLLKNYTGKEKINLYLFPNDKTMSIDDVWGTVEQNITSDNSTIRAYSKYNGANFEYTTVEEGGTEQTIPTPIINVTSNHIMSLSCPLEGVNLYYTLDDNRPSTSSSLFTSLVEITENCIIKAIAVKDGVSSEVASYTVSDFICSSPIIKQADNSNKISMSCASTNATIYYTLDNSTPTSRSLLYSGEIEISESCIVKAIALRRNFKDSPVASKSVVYYQSGMSDPVSGEVVILDNKAGELSGNVSEADMSSATRWSISGELNGTDVKYLREVFKIGKITDLDLSNAIIVSGGLPYYSIGTSEYNTVDLTIGHHMFSNAKSLISLSLPKTTSGIESYAIQGCDNLSSLIIPDQCKLIEDNAIWSCGMLTSIHLGRQTNTFGGGNGNLCKSLAQITVDSQNESFKSIDGVLYDMDMSSLYKYPAAKNGTDFVVPTSIKVIKESAFSNSVLESIALPSGLERVETSAFNGCRELKEVTLPNNVTYIGMFAFQNCASLIRISIPDGVKELKSFCFGYCVNLNSCHLGSGLEEIDGSAFTGALSLASFSVSEDNEFYMVNDGILYSKDMTKLVRCPSAYYSEELFLNEDIRFIESNAFANCTGILKFKLPENLQEIGSSAFAYCNMEVIKIPNTVNKIGMFAFQGCDKLKSFAVPTGLTEIPEFMLSSCDDLNYLYIPQNISSIDSYAFSLCKNLTTIESWIDNFNTVEIAVSYDGDYTPFIGIAENCTWHVPSGCTDMYKMQPWWKYTWSIIDDLQTASVSSIYGNDLNVQVADGSIIVESGRDITVNIYNIGGIHIHSIEVKNGIQESIALPTGIYLINGKKYIVK